MEENFRKLRRTVNEAMIGEFPIFTDGPQKGMKILAHRPTSLQVGETYEGFRFVTWGGDGMIFLDQDNDDRVVKCFWPSNKCIQNMQGELEGARRTEDLKYTPDVLCVSEQEVMIAYSRIRGSLMAIPNIRNQHILNERTENTLSDREIYEYLTRLLELNQRGIYVDMGVAAWNFVLTSSGVIFLEPNSHRNRSIHGVFAYRPIMNYIVRYGLEHGADQATIATSVISSFQRFLEMNREIFSLSDPSAPPDIEVEFQKEFTRGAFQKQFIDDKEAELSELFRSYFQ
ncbi:MAG: hypothetical protein WCT46_05905 [Candidatus Gracilibacteria bacterium]|jgi:hypothetical protein